MDRETKARMERGTTFAEMPDVRGPVFMAAGFFDGIHRGHQRVITAARTAARAAVDGMLWVLTFESHPLRILAPGRAPPLLMSEPQKMRMLETMGVNGCLSLPFDRSWAALQPEEFLDLLRREIPGWTALFIGPNWRFGHRAAGDEGGLRAWAARHGIAVTATPPVMWDGRMISSTRIRDAVCGGKLDQAAAMLGRPFSLTGTVKHGRAIGRRLGYPTANVRPENEVLPPRGVYAVAVDLDDGDCCRGVMNLGQRPTFAQWGHEAEPVMEVHLYDKQRDLYRRRVEVFVFERLRDERRFDTMDGLREQIADDIEAADRILEKRDYIRALQMP